MSDASTVSLSERLTKKHCNFIAVLINHSSTALKVKVTTGNFAKSGWMSYFLFIVSIFYVVDIIIEKNDRQTIFGSKIG